MRSRAAQMIDIPTVILWNGVALSLVGTFFLLYWGWQSRSAGLFWWYLPFLFGLLAAFSVLAREMSFAFWGERGSTVLIILAYGGLWQAARVFGKRSHVMLPVVVLVAGWLALSVALGHFGGSAYFDTLFRGALITLFNGGAAYEFWRGRRREPLPSRMAVVFILAVNALFQAAIHVFSPFLPAPLGVQEVTAWAVVIYNAEVLFLALSMAMLVIALFRERVAEEYHQLAIHDPLTGLLNRLTFDTHLADEASGPTGPYALMVIDIDHFKKINDSFGHHVGDAVIVQAARTIERGLRRSDRLYRFGGEEFVCLLPDVNADVARMVAERIRKSFADVITLVPEGEVRATISIGVAASRDGSRERAAVMADADSALYLAKRGGRNRVEVSTFDQAAA